MIGDVWSLGRYSMSPKWCVFILCYGALLYFLHRYRPGPEPITLEAVGNQ